MNGNRLALDTSVVIALLNDAGDTREWLRNFDQLMLPVVVIGELRFGALNSQRAPENTQRINDFVAAQEVLPITNATTTAYARIRLQLKRAGKPIPDHDIWIAATCIEHDLQLATGDGHFESVEGLKVERR